MNTHTTTTTTDPGDAFARVQMIVNGILPRVERIDEVLNTPALADTLTDLGLERLHNERARLVEQLERELGVRA